MKKARPGLCLLILALGFAGPAVAAVPPIDRQALVTRHNPVIRAVDFDAPLTVGNGGFAFTADITGLQTFAEAYQRRGVPTETQSRWAWVSDPNPHGYTLADASKVFRQADGRQVAFPTLQSSPAGDWLRKNPRSHPLAQIGFEFDKLDGSPLTPDDIQAPEQTLDLWRGVITSKFMLEGVPVIVTTACHPAADVVAVRVVSDLVTTGRLRVRLAFPRGHDLGTKNTPGYDWSQPEAHTSVIAAGGLISRHVGNLDYSVKVGGFPGTGSNSRLTREGPHQFRLAAQPGGIDGRLDFTVGFYRGTELPRLWARLDDVVDESARHWAGFWRSGGAVDFTGSTSPLAGKFEKRIVLSQYLMAVQMAGDAPPQESGLTCNTWYGKHHTEMIWWHTAQFALWGREALLEKNLAWFRAQLPAARAIAAGRGLRGARWAKMTGPEMRESPGGNPLIVWNQPHPIYLAELLYRSEPTPATLARNRELVLETADGLASMLHFDEGRGVYVLGPPLWLVQEIYDQATSQNPTFELSYWHWALGVAQQWRERLGLPREEKWDHIRAHLAPLPVKDGKYVGLESMPDTWDNVDSRHDHPSMLMPLGMLPGGPDVDRATMGRTLDAVVQHWDWETKIWGWDYPMIAMTAARLGRPALAVEILLRDGPNNIYLANGHCPQRSDTKLDPNAPPGRPRREIAVYLPANGSFLAAAALMLAGWDGAVGEQPGMPRDGTWQVRVEGLKRMP